MTSLYEEAILPRLPGVTEELESRGMNPSSGRFEKGNKFGRPKGSRGKLTQLMLDRVSEAGMSPDEVLIDLYQDPSISPDLRFKAAAKVAELVYPRAASVEVKVEEVNANNEEAINNQLRDFLSAHLGKDVLPPEDYDIEESILDDKR